MVAIDLITEHIRMKLQQHDLRRIYPNLEVSGGAAPSRGRVCTAAAGRHGRSQWVPNVQPCAHVRLAFVPTVT